MSKIKTISLIIILQFLVLMPMEVFAIDVGGTGLNITAGQGFLGPGKTATEPDLKTAGMITSIPEGIGKVIGAGLSFLGIAFMLLIIYGGFMWMFARGNDQAVGKAKEIITAAVIGLVIVLAAYAITNFIGTNLLT